MSESQLERREMVASLFTHLGDSLTALGLLKAACDDKLPLNENDRDDAIKLMGKISYEKVDKVYSALTCLEDKLKEGDDNEQ